MLPPTCTYIPWFSASILIRPNGYRVLSWLWDWVIWNAEAPKLVASVTCFTSLGKEGFFQCLQFQRAWFLSVSLKGLISFSFSKPSLTLLSANRVSLLVSIGLVNISSLANRCCNKCFDFVFNIVTRRLMEMWLLIQKKIKLLKHFKYNNTSVIWLLIHTLLLHNALWTFTYPSYWP